MPANDSMPYRGASAVRAGRRFTPYQSTESTGLKSHLSCPTLSIQLPSAPLVSSPEDSSLDSSTEISSTATLVNPSFDSDKPETPSTPVWTDFPLKSCEKNQSRQSFHQKKVDYVAHLIDFACKTLNELWPIPTIPSVFRYQHGATFGYTSETNGIPLEDFKCRNCPTDLIPLRKFVQELLRRSRSTCSTLQTALCYIEAIRHKIPEYQLAEQEGRGIRGDQVDNDGRIEMADCLLCRSKPSPPHSIDQCKLPGRCRKAPLHPDTPLPQLPSALLCPRRTFMGALVLSAKFVQDKCYSNRAWAKLCGLPAREVSRCERALGDALEWRLWVGKDKGFAFAGLESKLGRAPTMLQSCPAIDDKRDIVPEKFISAPLARAKTWPLQDSSDPAATVLITGESDFSMSPTPSLTFSSNASTCSSGGLSPTYPSPLPAFVPNDPCSPSSKSELTQLRLANFLNNTAFDVPMFNSCGEFLSTRPEQDDFGIRVAESIQVV